MNIRKVYFPEDSLDLLGPEIHQYNPHDYYNFVQSLYNPTKKRGKKQAILKPKGKNLLSPTKRSRDYGEFEISYLSELGEKKVKFKYSREKSLSEYAIKELSKLILCPVDLIQDLLQNKKFKITTCNSPLDFVKN